jgi:hypothetical protein
MKSKNTTEETIARSPNHKNLKHRSDGIAVGCVLESPRDRRRDDRLATGAPAMATWK